MNDPRSIAVAALDRVLGDGGYSNIVLDKCLTDAGVTGLDAAFAASLFYGTLERVLTLDHVIEKASGRQIKKIDKCCINILRTGVYQIYYMDKVHDGAAVNESVKLIKRTAKPFLSGFVNAVLRKITRDREAYLPDRSDTASYYSCSPSIVNELIEDYGEDETIRILECSFGGTETVVRVNNTKVSDGEFIKLAAEYGAECEVVMPHYVRLGGNTDLIKTPLYGNGLFHVQTLVSGICAETVGARRGDRILDACAAPGGKTFAMAENAFDDCHITALELHPHRAELIKKGADRLGLGSVNAVVADAALYEGNGILFDRVLCDVPCSGTGMMAEKPDIKYKDAAAFEGLRPVQLGIINNCSRLVRPGGRLVYSTCTLRKKENEYITAEFLKNNSEFRLVSQKTYLPKKRLSGFFIAVIERCS